MLSVFLELVPVGLLQGLVLAILAMGIMIPFKMLNFPDLTAEGSYTVGGILFASLLLAGWGPFPAMVGAAAGGGLMGVGTAFVHVRLKVNTLLAGIIVSTLAYSINLRLLGRPNVALFEHPTLFSSIESLAPKLILVGSICSLIIGLLYAFLRTEKGLRLRAVGRNPAFAQHQGCNLAGYSFLGLFLGNMLNSFAGCLMVQLQQYVDIHMGVGITLHALAALMIGEIFMGISDRSPLLSQVAAPAVGAIVYQQVQGLALTIGCAPSDLKLITGGVLLLAVAYRQHSVK